MNDPSQMMNRNFAIWHPAPPQPAFNAAAKPGRMHWKRKKAAAAAAAAVAGGSGAVAASGYKPPTLKDLQFQNRLKARRFYPKKKQARVAPSAPWNTTSFIIRAKKSGGIASLVSPCPVTPAILPTPKFSPSREGLVDMAKEEWGVDGYGSMKGLIRLRHGGGAAGEEFGGGDDDEVEEGSSESDSDVEEHLEVERRLDHDLSRFEMVYPSPPPSTAAYLIENRVDDNDTHITRLEEENMTLKERVFLVEREMDEMRRRLTLLETEFRARDGNNNGDGNNSVSGNEEASENGGGGVNDIEEASENDGGGDVCSEKSAGDCEESTEMPTAMPE